jgi:trk system potassium uptake protein TrkA
MVLVVGLGRLGRSLVTSLSRAGHEVLAIDLDNARVKMVADEITQAVQGDATQEDVLREMGASRCDIAFIAVGENVESSVMSTILLKNLGVKRVVARAMSDLHGSILEKIGADTVVYPLRDMGFRMAHTATLTGVSDYMQIAPGFGIARLDAPPVLVGKNLEAFGFGQKERRSLAFSILQRGKEIIVNPSLKEIIREGDTLVIIGRDDDLEELLAEARNQFEEEAREDKNGKPAETDKKH